MSPVIATILMVAITVVLAAVLYVMVMGFGGDEAKTPNVSLGQRATAANTYEVYVISVSGGNIALTDVEAVVVSGPAKTIATGSGATAVAAGGIISVGSEHTNLQAGDKAVIQAVNPSTTPGAAAGTGEVVVMFRDIASGSSLGQVTLTVSYPAVPSP